MREVVFGEFCCGIEISLAECRSSATTAILHERDFESDRLEHFRRSDADMRFVVAHKRVVPKNDGASAVAAGGDGGVVALGKSLAAGVTAPGYSLLGKPSVEAFASVMRHGASSGNSDCFLQCEACRLETEKSIRHPRH